MEDATLGGLALSQGMTTHSHRCGLVSDTVTDYELVTGDGKIVVASETHNTDVFRAVPFSHGSLGFLTSLSLRVVPAQKELLVSYRKFGSVKELRESLVTSVETTDAFFLEGVIHSTSHTVLIRGDLLSGEEVEKLRKEGVPTNKQGQWWKEWFFVHTSRVEDGHRELMPMRDYLMRHDKSLCMTMKYVFPAGNHPLLRYTRGWMLPPRVQFLKSLRPPEVRMETAQSQVYQDLAVPHESFCELVDLAKTEFHIFPLMVYPCKIVDRGGFIRIPADRRHSDDGHTSSHLYLNMGLYGVPLGVRDQTLGYSTIGSVRRVLDLVRSVGGFQHSYCDVFQTPEEFEEMFDHALANEVRKKVGSEALPGVYGKVRPEVDWEKELAEAA
ncbi:hypothetical protein HDU93_005363 [Gonapodya sp. JEL0774]|nr:hypothetical protein HDU93_005363 [Gonapodya sp. JEL0774]